MSKRKCRFSISLIDNPALDSELISFLLTLSTKEQRELLAIWVREQYTKNKSKINKDIRNLSVDNKQNKQTIDKKYQDKKEINSALGSEIIEIDENLNQDEDSSELSNDNQSIVELSFAFEESEDDEDQEEVSFNKVKNMFGF